MSLPPIITPDELNELQADRNVVICDVRWYMDNRSGQEAYLEGHLPGAIFVDLDEHLTAPPRPSAGRHPLPAAASLATGLGALGISADDVVVAYDDAAGMSAGRLAWMLRILGQPAALLDGGIQLWPGDLEQVINRRPSVFCPIRPWPTDCLASADETELAAQRGERVLDARAAERFRGDVEPIDRKAGHIPGAVNHPFSTNLDDSGRFLSSDELRSRYEATGVTESTSTIVYCGSGVSACHNLLAMERAGLTQARLYPGSWSQWSRDDSRSVATGP